MTVIHKTKLFLDFSALLFKREEKRELLTIDEVVAGREREREREGFSGKARGRSPGPLK